jgi:hypothetical protein
MVSAHIAKIKSPSTDKTRNLNWPHIFDYDFFISSKPGSLPKGTQGYVSDLARRLSGQDFEIFFSEEE